MTDIPDVTELDRIEAKILSTIDGAFKSGRKKYLLSQLGQELGPDLPKLKLLTGQSLRQFLSSRSPGRYDLVTLGEHQNIFAIIPIGSVIASEAEVHGEHPESELKRSPFRYNGRFWAAFLVPLAANAEVRLINLTSLQFKDVDSNTPPSSDWESISPDFIIPSPDMPNRTEEILTRIDRWLRDKGFPPERFGASQGRAGRTSQDARQGATVGTSILELMISALDHRQLRSLSLPLDVVQALLTFRFRK